jgi:hypothetical protein
MVERMDRGWRLDMVQGLRNAEEVHIAGEGRIAGEVHIAGEARCMLEGGHTTEVADTAIGNNRMRSLEERS